MENVATLEVRIVQIHTRLTFCFIFRTQRRGILALTRDKQDKTECNGNITRKQGVSGSSKNHVFVDRIDRIQGKTWMENWKKQQSKKRINRTSNLQFRFQYYLDLLGQAWKKFHDYGCLVKKEFDKTTSEWRPKVSRCDRNDTCQVVWFVGINQQLCSVEVQPVQSNQLLILVSIKLTNYCSHIKRSFVSLFSDAEAAVS